MLKYNGVGSLTRDDSRGIALIEYDDMNAPKAKGLFALTGRNSLRLFLIISGSMSQKYS
jgi:hypothetical protein